LNNPPRAPAARRPLPWHGFIEPGKSQEMPGNKKSLPGYQLCIYVRIQSTRKADLC